MAKYLVLLLLVLVLIAVPIISGALAQDLSKCTLIGCNPDPTCPGWCDTSSWCGWRFWENQMKRDAICFYDCDGEIVRNEEGEWVYVPGWCC